MRSQRVSADLFISLYDLPWPKCIFAFYTDVHDIVSNTELKFSRIKQTNQKIVQNFVWTSPKDLPKCWPHPKHSCRFLISVIHLFSFFIMEKGQTVGVQTLHLYPRTDYTGWKLTEIEISPRLSELKNLKLCIEKGNLSTCAQMSFSLYATLYVKVTPDAKDRELTFFNLKSFMITHRILKNLSASILY